MAWARSLLFQLAFVPWTALCSVAFLLLRLAGLAASWPAARMWSRGVLALLRILVGARTHLLGRELLPPGPAVVLAKHQSALETIAMPLLVPQFVWVLKRELLRIPVFGWALWATGAIAIARDNPRRALREVLERGTAALRRGLWVAMFPEGTRVAPGKTGRYQGSGVALAKKADAPIVLVAVATGHVWPRGSARKRPGEAFVEVVGVIPAEEVRARGKGELLEEARTRIEEATRRLERRAGIAA